MRIYLLLGAAVVLMAMPYPCQGAGTKPVGFFARMFGATQATALADDTGGSTCAGCGIIVGLVEQLSQLYNSTVDEAMEALCSYLPREIQGGCRVLIKTYGPVIIEFLESKETADVVCHALGLCKTPPGTEMCHIFPLPPSSSLSKHHMSKHVQTLRRRALEIAQEHDLQRLRKSLEVGAPPEFCKWPVIDEVCKIIDKFADDHLPVDDLDGDKFSDLPSARGSSWRGKDCNDVDGKIYPGRKAADGDRFFDTNCNGISGLDERTGTTYEEQWCSNTSQYGIIVMGDSIGAHFHIPPQWLNVTEIGVLAFEHLIFMVTNELDWPQLSMTTGHYNASRWSHAIDGPMDSIYQRFLDLNRCNHRDFQNIGVNGARSTSMAEHIVASLARHTEDDQPVMMIFELVGNDVCNGHPGTSHMTPPQEFYDAQLTSLRYIDAHVPKGSHVALVGLADGRFLYNHMHARTHPLGALRNDVTYSEFYTYLNCLGVSPCWGWMNTNETWRNATTAHAFLLNQQLEKLAKTENFENIAIQYSAYDIQAAADIWAKQGGQPWQLIEPVDGFHANQIGNALGAEVFWNKIQVEHPAWLPAANPHNNDIIQKFGDQGGY